MHAVVRFAQKSSIYTQKNPIYTRRSPIFTQKSPVFTLPRRGIKIMRAVVRSSKCVCLCWRASVGVCACI